MSKQFLTAPELAELVGVSLSKAYGYIRQMNGELQQKGFLTVRGKVNRLCFGKIWSGSRAGWW